MNTIEWRRNTCSDLRVELYLAGERTPYFIDQATHGTERFTLSGAGMGPLTSAGYRIAGELGWFRRISEAKARALELCQQPV